MYGGGGVGGQRMPHIVQSQTQQWGMGLGRGEKWALGTPWGRFGVRAKVL